MTPAELKAIREELKLTQRELASWLGMHPINGKRTIRRWESNEINEDGSLRFKIPDHKAQQIRDLLETEWVDS